MEGVKEFFVGYWDFSRSYLIALVVVYLIAAVPFRQPGKAIALVVVGIYVTMTAYFLPIYEELGLNQEWALGIVIVCGLGIGSLFYYTFFILGE